MPKKKILLVDDSKTVLFVERTALRGSPYEVVTAANGEECLAQVAADRPDLILLDLVMPVMDGFETCRKLRSNPATREIPIVIVTTRGEAENVAAGRESGCSAYLTKPINNAELLAKIRELLGD